MRLHTLEAPKGAKGKKKRVGRGESSGWGKFSGRGSGGQGQRSGTGKPRPGFEGGQTPMFRRMPKRGFTNIFAKSWAVVNVDVLAKHFDAGATVNLESLRGRGLAAKKDAGVRVLGRGDLSHALTIEANHFSKTAREKIEAAGGTALVLTPKVGGPKKKAKTADAS